MHPAASQRSRMAMFFFCIIVLLLCRAGDASIAVPPQQHDDRAPATSAADSPSQQTTNPNNPNHMSPNGPSSRSSTVEDNNKKNKESTTDNKESPTTPSTTSLVDRVASVVEHPQAPLPQAVDQQKQPPQQQVVDPQQQQQQHPPSAEEPKQADPRIVVAEVGSDAPAPPKEREQDETPREDRHEDEDVPQLENSDPTATPPPPASAAAPLHGVPAAPHFEAQQLNQLIQSLREGALDQDDVERFLPQEVLEALQESRENEESVVLEVTTDAEGRPVVKVVATQGGINEKSSSPVKNANPPLLPFSETYDDTIREEGALEIPSPSSSSSSPTAKAAVAAVAAAATCQSEDAHPTACDSDAISSTTTTFLTEGGRTKNDAQPLVGEGEKESQQVRRDTAADAMTGKEEPTEVSLSSSVSSNDEKNKEEDEEKVENVATDEDPTTAATNLIKTTVPASEQESSSSSLHLQYTHALHNLTRRGATFEDRRNVVKVLESLADQGFSRAYWPLAVLYSHGIGVDRSEAKAVLYHTMGVLSHVPESHAALAMRHLHGTGVKKSCERAYFHGQRVVDAVFMADKLHLRRKTPLEPVRSLVDQAGSDISITSLRRRVQNWLPSFFTEWFAPREGTASVSGRAGSAKSPRAMLAYNAERGHTKSKVKLAKAYAYGEFDTVPDGSAALQFLKEAAEAGEPEAHGVRGFIYLTGVSTPNPETSVQPDVVAAIQAFRDGYDKNDPRSMNGLGYLYSVGVKGHLRRDLKEAARLFKLAINFGSNEARYNYAVMKLSGLGGEPQNVFEAYHLLSQAEVMDSLHASWQLGHLVNHDNFTQLMLKYNDGTRKSCRRAMEHWSKVLDYASWTEHMTLGKRAYADGDLANAVLHFLFLGEAGQRIGLQNAALLLFVHTEQRDVWQSLFGSPAQLSSSQPQQQEGPTNQQQQQEEKEQSRIVDGSPSDSHHLDRLRYLLYRTLIVSRKNANANYMVGELYRRNLISMDWISDDDDDDNVAVVDGTSTEAGARLQKGDDEEQSEENAQGARSSSSSSISEAARLQLAEKHDGIAATTVPQARFNMGMIHTFGALGARFVGPLGDVLSDFQSSFLTYFSSFFSSSSSSPTLPERHSSSSSSFSSAAKKNIIISTTDYHLAKRDFDHTRLTEPESHNAVRVALVGLNLHWLYTHFDAVHEGGFWGSVYDGLVPQFVREWWPLVPKTGLSRTVESRTPSRGSRGTSAPSTFSSSSSSLRWQVWTWEWTTVETYAIMGAAALVFIVEMVKHSLAQHGDGFGRGGGGADGGRAAAAGGAGEAAAAAAAAEAAAEALAAEGE